MLEAWIGINVSDGRGLTEYQRVVASDSFLTAFPGVLLASMRLGTSTLTSHDGTVNTGITTNGLYINGGSATSTQSTIGIVVGTNATAVAFANTGLANRVGHGTGAGQMLHGSMTFLNPATTGGTRQFQAIRNFVNTSGGTIVVQECGVYAQLWIDQPGNTNTLQGNMYCIIRDLTGSVVVGNTKTLTITYTIGISA